MFDKASKLLIFNPDMYQKLQKIHQNPKYYSTWYLLTIEGHQYRKGSVPAEQNHSSIDSHFDGELGFSLPEQIQKLFNRYDQRLSAMQNAEMEKCTQTAVQGKRCPYIFKR